MILKTALLIFPLLYLTDMVLAQGGKVGINTNAPEAMLHVKDSSVLFSGATYPPLSPGSPPASGQGVRMMWYPDKVAFRAGFVYDQNWDKDSVGLASFATGFNTRASGEYSIAMGLGSVASNYTSTAIGYIASATGEYSIALGLNSFATGKKSITLGEGNTASGISSIAIGNFVYASGQNSTALGFISQATGYRSTALGFGTKAVGVSSTAMGSQCYASGDISTAMGEFTNAHGYASLVIGQFNDTIVAPQTSVTSSTPLFIIGNGDDGASLSNAMVVRKDGRTGIGTNTPDNRLDVRSDGTSDTAQIVLGLISNISNRPVLQFSENATATPTSGISLEYNGVGGVSNSKLHIRGADAVRRVTFMHDGRTGIGTESPTRELSIFDIGENGDAVIGLSTDIGGAKEMIIGLNQSSGGLFGTLTSTDLHFRTSNANRMTITSGGNIGIGSTAPSEKLHVAGNICYTGSISACSDRRYKRDITSLAEVIPKLSAIGAYTYTWDTAQFPDKGFTAQRQLGVIAQELQEIFPEVVLCDPEGFLSVDYSRLTVILLAGMKEQQAFIYLQQNTLHYQETLINELMARVTALEQESPGKNKTLLVNPDAGSHGN